MIAEITDIELEELNKVYQKLNPIQRLKKVFQDFDHDDILVTSSFGTTSGILIGMVSKAAPGHPIYLIDTSFCFTKAIGYKQTLTERLGLNIVHILPSVEDNTMAREVKLWKSDTDKYRHINKVKHFEP